MSMAGLIDHLTFAWKFSQNPISTLSAEHYKEKVVKKEVFNRTILYVYDEDVIKHVFATNSKNYPLSFVRRIVFNPIMPDGMLVSLGEPWKAARKATAPIFTPGFIESLNSAVQHCASKSASQLALDDGQTVPITEFMQELTMRLLVASLFDGCETFDIRKFIATVRELRRLAGIPHTFDLLSLPIWVPRVGRPDVTLLCGQLRDTARVLLDHAKANGPSGSLMARVLGLESGNTPIDDEVALDHLLSFLLAGYDTTARAFIWSSFLISQHPEVRAKVNAEVAALGSDPAHPDRLPYLQAVIRESMRLYPPVADLSRVALADDQVGDLKIKAGTTINVANFVLHRRAEYYDRPLDFNPDRFMDPDAVKMHKYTYLPFGIGPRVCIGMTLAMLELSVGLAEVYRKVSLEHVGDSEPEPVLRITLQASTPVMMRVTARIPASDIPLEGQPYAHL
jgi:cytochrome P450